MKLLFRIATLVILGCFFSIPGLYSDIAGKDSSLSEYRIYPEFSLEPHCLTPVFSGLIRRLPSGSKSAFFLDSGTPVEISFDGISLSSPVTGFFNTELVPNGFVCTVRNEPNASGSSRNPKTFDLNPSISRRREVLGQTVVGANRLAVSACYSDIAGKNFYYSGKFNYLRGRTGRLSAGIPEDRQYDSDEVLNSDYRYISGFGAVGIRDQKSDISMNFLITDGQYGNPEPATAISAYSPDMSDETHFLLYLKYQTELNAGSLLKGKMYYRNAISSIAGNELSGIDYEGKDDVFGGSVAVEFGNSRFYPSSIEFDFSKTGAESYSLFGELPADISQVDLTADKKIAFSENIEIDIDMAYGLSETRLADSLVYHSGSPRAAVSVNYDNNRNTKLTLSSQYGLFLDLPKDYRRFGNDFESRKSISITGIYEQKFGSLGQINLGVTAGQFETPEYEVIFDTGRQYLSGRLSCFLSYKYLGIDALAVLTRLNNSSEQLFSVPTLYCNINPKIEYKSFVLSFPAVLFEGASELSTRKYTDFLRFDAFAAYRTGFGLNIFARVNNISDSYIEYYPGVPSSGRNIEFGISFR